MPMTHQTEKAKSPTPNRSDVADIENDREFKAHVYQHLIDLQPFLGPDSQVAVLVQADDPDDVLEEVPGAGGKIALTLVATMGEYRLESEGRDENVYEAFGIAKRLMIQQLDEYLNSAVDTTERDAEIEAVVEGQNILH